jgi:hypothetical protein
MLGSPNYYRGNAPLAMRLKIHDLHAQLAPLERYGVGDMSSAIAGGVRALLRGFTHIRLRRRAVILSVAFDRRIP